MSRSLAAGLLSVVVVLLCPSAIQTKEERLPKGRWNMLQDAVNATSTPNCGRNYLADPMEGKRHDLCLRTDKSCSLLESGKAMTAYSLGYTPGDC